MLDLLFYLFVLALYDQRILVMGSQIEGDNSRILTLFIWIM